MATAKVYFEFEIFTGFADSEDASCSKDLMTDEVAFFK